MKRQLDQIKALIGILFVFCFSNFVLLFCIDDTSINALTLVRKTISIQEEQQRFINSQNILNAKVTGYLVGLKSLIDEKRDK